MEVFFAKSLLSNKRGDYLLAYRILRIPWNDIDKFINLIIIPSNKISLIHNHML